MSSRESNRVTLQPVQSQGADLSRGAHPLRNAIGQSLCSTHGTAGSQCKMLACMALWVFPAECQTAASKSPATGLERFVLAE